MKPGMLRYTARGKRQGGWSAIDGNMLCDFPGFRFIRPFVDYFLYKHPVLRGTHNEIARDAFLSLRCPKELDRETLERYASWPDLHDTHAMAINHEFNPDGYENGDKYSGGGLIRVKAISELLLQDLKKGNTRDTSYHASILCHYLADICVPFHADGKWVHYGDDRDKHPTITDNGGRTDFPVGRWEVKNLFAHGWFEFCADLAKNSELVTPHYITGGIEGIADRYIAEAKISRESLQSFLDGNGKIDQKLCYQRAVQLTADVWFTLRVETDLAGRKRL